MGRLSEVQLLVLLSFTLQLFLFFTGSLRRRSRSQLLRGTIWIAYLGADMVAIYALGILSRDATMDDPSAFLWAPFILIHLGGQDTITAFAIEDNKLWLRHLLNLLVQVSLALYVFWKSSSWHSTQQVLVPGILLFVAGIIKYGERIAALRHGDLNRRMGVISSTYNNNNSRSEQCHQPKQKPAEDVITKMISGDALRSAPGVRMLFASHTTAEVAGDLKKIVQSYAPPSNRHGALFRLMDVELGMMYSDLYTKAAVLRTKSGIVFRCISLACTVAALILFFFSSSSATNSNSRVDTAITYTLFIGGLGVDVCSLLAVLLASPRTWAWLQAHGHRRIACVSWCLLSWESLVSSGCLGTTTTTSRRRPLWSNTMGQYRFVCYDNDSESWSPPPSTLSERVMDIIRKLVGAEWEKKKLFWLNRLLETKHVVVDDNVTLCLVKEIDDIAAAAAAAAHQHHQHTEKQQWQCLGQLLLAATQQPELTNDFVRLISWLHACTEVLLFKAAEAAAADKGISIATGTAGAAASADVCRKLSRYMMYLVAARGAGGGASSLLQVVSGNPETEFQRWDRYSDNISCRRGEQQQQACMRLLCECDDGPKSGSGGGSSSSSSSRIMVPSTTLWPCPEMWEETLEELKHMWARLLVYAAAKSRPEAHAAALARGGELLTFVWLLLSHHGLGGVSSSTTTFQVGLDLVKGQPCPSPSGLKSGTRYYVFNNLPVVQMVNFPQLHNNKLESTPTGSHSHQLAHSGADPS